MFPRRLLNKYVDKLRYNRQPYITLVISNN